MINSKEKALIIVEYENIIWVYKIFYGSYKKKFNMLLNADERWKAIDEQLEIDLRLIGLENLKNHVINHLKNNYYFEYKEKICKNFKKYCL